MNSDSPSYSHTYKAPPGVMAMLFFGWLSPIVMLTFRVDIVAGIAAGIYMGIAVALIIATFHHLTVRDLGQSLVIRFGPLPLFCKTLKFADIEKVEVGRTLSWPIQPSIQGGWVWNPGGFDCVVVHLKERVFRIGTDDAANLSRFLEGKINERNETTTAAPKLPQSVAVRRTLSFVGSGILQTFAITFSSKTA
jgi:hypothetical protein